MHSALIDLQATVPRPTQLDAGAQPSQQTDPGDGWFSIQKILKHQKRENKMFYQVLWDDNSRSWKPEADVSKYAVDAYWITKNDRKRRRRK